MNVYLSIEVDDKFDFLILVDVYRERLIDVIDVNGSVVKLDENMVDKMKLFDDMFLLFFDLDEKKILIIKLKNIFRMKVKEKVLKK